MAKTRILFAFSAVVLLLLCSPIVPELLGTRVGANDWLHGPGGLHGVDILLGNLGTQGLAVAADDEDIALPEGSDDCVRKLLSTQSEVREQALEQICRHQGTQQEALHRILQSSRRPETILGAIEAIGTLGGAQSADLLACKYLTLPDPRWVTPAGKRWPAERVYPAVGVLVTLGSAGVDAVTKAVANLNPEDTQGFENAVYVLESISFETDVLRRVRSLKRTTYVQEHEKERLEELIARLENKHREWKDRLARLYPDESWQKAPENVELGKEPRLQDLPSVPNDTPKPTLQQGSLWPPSALVLILIVLVVALCTASGVAIGIRVERTRARIRNAALS
jgi:hypothetical protein